MLLQIIMIILKAISLKKWCFHTRAFFKENFQSSTISIQCRYSQTQLQTWFIVP